MAFLAFGRARLMLLALPLMLAAALLAAPVQAKPAQQSNNSSQKLRAAVTLEGVRRHQAAFQQIADENGGTRFAGLPGHDASATYVFNKLKAAGYNPWYHEFSYDAFFEESPSELEQTAPAPATYVRGTDFRIMSYSGSGEVTAPVSTPSGDERGCFESDFAGFTAGNIALVQRGTPTGFSHPTFGTSCTFRLKADNATKAGATAILVYNNVDGVVNGTLGASGLSNIPALGLSKALGDQLVPVADAGELRMRAYTDTFSEVRHTRNVLAETATGNPDNVVMVGAHLDSVAAGPGINDNGSGSAAILETAIQMAKVEPSNKVRFAWWSAEESGLIGATRYIQSLSQADKDKIALYLNFDMIGSPNFVRFIYDGDNSAALPSGVAGPAGSAAIEQMFIDYFQSQDLATEPTPFNGRSDYGPFIAAGVGIPAGGLFTGAEGIKTPAQALTYGGTAGAAYDPCYHAACDDYDNNSDEVLAQMSDAVAHATITYAQNTYAVNGVEGKGGPRTSTSGATNDGSTPGGGGGLHDDHHDEES